MAQNLRRPCVSAAVYICSGGLETGGMPPQKVFDYISSETESNDVQNEKMIWVSRDSKAKK